MDSFLAIITPVGASAGAPPIASTGPGFPTAPIAPGGMPSFPPIASTGPGFPTAPIYIPIMPPANELPPGLEAGHPIYIPVYPSHQPVPPHIGGGAPPIASTGPGFPTAPIHIPTWDEIKGNIIGNLPPQPPTAAPQKK